MKELSHQRWKEYRVSPPSLRVCKQWLDTSGSGILTHGGKQFRPVVSKGPLEGPLGLFSPSPREASTRPPPTQNYALLLPARLSLLLSQHSSKTQPSGSSPSSYPGIQSSCGLDLPLRIHWLFPHHMPLTFSPAHSGLPILFLVTQLRCHLLQEDFLSPMLAFVFPQLLYTYPHCR